MDDPELKNLLKEDVRLAAENNRMLKYIYRSSRLAIAYSIIKWLIFVGIAIGSFYFLKPYLDTLSATYQTITGHNLPDFSKYFGK